MVKDVAVMEMMIRLRKIDRRGLTLRDVLILWVVSEYPGSTGQDIVRRLGLENRSNIQFNLPRLIRQGLMEDRRPEQEKGVANAMYITPAGLAFWDEIKPA